MYHTRLCEELHSQTRSLSQVSLTPIFTVQNQYTNRQPNPFSISLYFSHCSNKGDLYEPLVLISQAGTWDVQSAFNVSIWLSVILSTQCVCR